MYIVADILGVDMVYYTFSDFMKRRYEIKELLKNKDNEYVAIYRMYVESRPWMKEWYRECIWDFLNDYMSDAKLLEEYEKFCLKYGDKGA